MIARNCGRSCHDPRREGTGQGRKRSYSEPSRGRGITRGTEVGQGGVEVEHVAAGSMVVTEVGQGDFEIEADIMIITAGVALAINIL